VSDRTTDTVQTFFIAPGSHGLKDKLVGITRGAKGGYGSLAYSPNGQLLVRGEPGGFVVFKPTGQKVAVGVPTSPVGPPMPAAFAGDDHVVTCQGDQLQYWDIQAPQAPKFTATLVGTCAALAVSADGKRFAVTMTSGANAAVNVGYLPTTWK